MRPSIGSTVRLALWTAALVVVVRLLLDTGSAQLSVPLTSRQALDDWTRDTPPPDMAIAVLRLGALALGGYLLVVTTLAVVARLAHLHRLAAVVDRVSPGVVRRLVSGGSGIGLLLGAAVAALPAADLASPSDRPTIAAATPGSLLAGPADGSGPRATMTQVTTALSLRTHVEATMTRSDGAQADATMTRIDVDPAPDDGAVPAALPADHARAAPTTPDAATVSRPAAPGLPTIDATSWTVEPGDSLWSIAEEATRRADGRRAAERTVSRYWQRMIDANRSQLVDPGNADLLVPGQPLVLPPPDT